MSKEIKVYSQVKLITDKYADMGLLVGSVGTVFEKFSDTDFLVDFTRNEDFETGGRNGVELIDITFHADELEPL